MKHVNVAVFVPHAGCEHDCAFCNQRTISGAQKLPEPKDVEEAARIAIDSGKPGADSEIAFFGGSFTAIDRGYMLSLLEAAYKFVQSGDFKGIRCSTRPDCIDAEVLTILKKYSVTSIELGAQSMSDRVLNLNGRGHTAGDTERASEMIKSFGFSLGLQMMTGLYGDDDETCLDSARNMAALEPDTMRIYPTIVLKGTKLEELLRSGEYRPQTLEESVNLCSKLLDAFESKGIRVIRLGLHSGGGLDDGYVAGPYHPAFRELCLSKLFLDKIISASEVIANRKITVSVNPKDISAALGQKKSNVSELEKLGIDARFVSDEKIERGKISVIRRD